MAQCRALVASLCAAVSSLETRELQVVTSGDRIVDRSLAEIGGKGLFVKEIEEALLERRADFAVHSIKDLPGSLPAGLCLACVPQRADPRDALVAPRHRTLDALPQGARVGTSSLRRAIQLRRQRPDLAIVPLRGNVDTRLRKVEAGECDAIVLAMAGLARLGLEHRATETLDTAVCLPAAGQGALGIECRQDDDETLGVVARVHHLETAICVAAERGVLVAVGGDCATPLAAHAVHAGNTLEVRAMLSRPDGTQRTTRATTVAWPATEAEARAIGMALGHELRG